MVHLDGPYSFELSLVTQFSKKADRFHCSHAGQSPINQRE
jgi:hypothetical protein